MTDAKKYRILSVEAEKLVHCEAVGGFSVFSGDTLNTDLFTGMLDYSLESEQLRTTAASKRLLRDTYFRENGHDYTTAIINVEFNYSRHDFVCVGGIFVLYRHSVSDAFRDNAEVAQVNGERRLIAIRLYHPLSGAPLPDDLLAPYFSYDEENNFYVRRALDRDDSEDGAISEEGTKIGEAPKKKRKKRIVAFSTLEDTAELRERLYRDGFYCDGLHYVRYKRSAGSSRAGQCLFIAEPLCKGMIKWSLCGLERNMAGETDLASLEAYISLSLSSLTDTLKIPKESILFLRDAKSRFTTHAISVEADADGHLFSREKDVEVTNTIWDGEALLDTSVFEQNGYGDCGMMLLRNRFFKACAFNTRIQQYFADNGITELSQLCGFTLASSVSDVRMIVTSSSLKFLKLVDSRLSFEEKISVWLRNVDDVFGLVKTDKPTGFFGGRVVRTSYQLINTLGLDRAETAELLKDTLDYYKNVRSTPAYMRNYINYTLTEDGSADREDERGAGLDMRYRAILGCLEQNDDFGDTAIYKEFRSSVLSSFSEMIRSGHLLVRGTNATILGNGLELLAASVGLFHEGDAPLALAGEHSIYCKHFPVGAALVGCRSPHVTMGNLLYAENTHSPLIDKYFSLTSEIVYVNAINSNIQHRLNGCDYDSDMMLLTDDPVIAMAVRRLSHFAVPVCSIASTKRAYTATPEGRAELDREIARNRIGEIINRSQLLNSLYWHNERNSLGSAEENSALYRDICLLAVLSGMEIDKAKRNYDVDADEVLTSLKSRYRISKIPRFFNFVMEKRRTEDARMSYDTTMDYVFEETLAVTRGATKDGKARITLKELAKRGLPESERESGDSNEARDREAITERVSDCCKRVTALRIEMHGADPQIKQLAREEITRTMSETLTYVSRKLRTQHMLLSLLSRIDKELSDADTENKRVLLTLFDMLCLESGHRLYSLLSGSRETDMFDLLPQESGDILIYGIPHTKKIVKSAK